MKTKVWICLFITLILLNSCKKDNPNNVKVPLLTTSAVSNITQTSITSGGNIPFLGSAIIARGVCWNTSQNPIITDSKTSDGDGFGDFTSAITGLTANVTYYVRAYATNSAGTGYGDNLIVKTYTGTITDIDVNSYYTVTIGTQVWMAENLQVTKYRNGEQIPNVTDGTAWSNLTTGAYCNYNNSPVNSTTYGKIYNWYAAVDPRNLCPAGWHLPSTSDWTVLRDYLGGISVASDKMKVYVTANYWETPNNGATNSSGFTALRVGIREHVNGEFFRPDYCGWWSSYGDVGGAKNFQLVGEGADFGYLGEAEGLSVRCLKD
jgi:uncharacterized protein (TIGR02145 family)